MVLLEHPLWQRDLELINETRMTDLHFLAGSIILITGATGLIGSSFVDLLLKYNTSSSSKIDIIIASRSFSKAANRYGKQLDNNEIKWIKYDADQEEKVIDFPVDYIIHAASNAYPNLIMKEPVETMKSNFIGLTNLFDIARKQKSKRILYISSSEVYGKNESALPFVEDQYGFIDLLNPRNSYSIAKRAAETLCASYGYEYGIESVIVRPGHIYGPTASVHDNRVSSAFAYQAARGESIVLKSEGNQLRSYCYCLDCASALVAAIVNGNPASAYNISNKDSIISIREMASIIAEAGGVNVAFDLPTEAERKAFTPMDNSSLDSTKLESIGWSACFSAREGLTHTVHILKDVYSL